MTTTMMLDEIIIDLTDVERESTGFKIFNLGYSVNISKRDFSFLDKLDEIIYQEDNVHINTPTGDCIIEYDAEADMIMDEILAGRGGIDPTTDEGNEILSAMNGESLTINDIIEVRALGGYIEFRTMADVEDIYSTLSKYLQETVFDDIHQVGQTIPEEDIEKMTQLRESLSGFINGDPDFSAFFSIIEATRDSAVVTPIDLVEPEVVGVEVLERVHINGVDLEILEPVTANISKYIR